MAGTSKLKQVGKVLGGTGLVGGAGLGGYAYGGAKGLEQGRREGFEAGYRRAKKEDRSAAMALSQGAQMRSQRRQMKRPKPEPQKQNQSTNSPEPVEQNTDEPETNMKSASVLKRAVSGMRDERPNDMQEESHLEVRKHDGGYVIVDPETGEIKSDKPYASRSKAEKMKGSMSGNTKTGEKGENLDRNEYFQNEAKEVLNRQNQLRRRKRKEQRKDNTATGGISGTAIGAAAAPMIGEIAPRRFENAASLASPIVTGLAGAGIGRSLSKNVPSEVDVENMETSMSDEPANPSAAKRMKNREGVDRKTVNIDYGNNQQKNKKYDFYHNKPGDSSNTMNQGSPDKEAKNSERASYKQDIDMENDCGCDKTASTKEADEDPCWEGYEQIGMKTKDGKKVPNCVPKDDEKSARILASATQSKNIKEASTKEADEDPCWEGYEQYGMKEKDGKQVPNCVPKDNEKSARILSHAANSNSEKTAGGTRMMQGQQQQMRQGQRQMSQGQRQMSQEQANAACPPRGNSKWWWQAPNARRAAKSGSTIGSSDAVTNL
jgi:outer membrane lipoprotein SlyB